MENEVIKNKYIALEEFEWNGETIEIDQIVELTDEEELRLGMHDKKRGKVKRKEKALPGPKFEKSSQVKPQLFE